MNRLYAVLLVSLELLWSYSVIVALTEWDWIGWPRPPVSLPMALALAAAALAPAMLDDRASRLRAVVLPLQVLLLAAVVRVEAAGGYALLDASWFVDVWDSPQVLLGATAYGAFLLWRGAIATSPLPVPERLHTRFLLGLAVLFFALLLGFFTDNDYDARNPLLSLGFYAVTYFGVGMAAIAIANLRDIRREMTRRSDTGLPSLREWMAVPMTAITGMLMVSLVFSAFFSFDLARFLLIPLEYIARGIAIAILYGIIFPLSFLAGGLTWLLQRLVRTVVDEEEQGGEAALEDDPLLVEQGEAVLFSDAALLALQWAAGIVVALVIILVLAKALSRFRRDRDDGGEEEVSESLGAWSGFRQDLGLFLAWLLGLFRRKERPVVEEAPLPVSVTGDTGVPREFTIREIYQGLLWEGRNAGRPRRDAETPYEYGSRIEPLDTTEERALDDITQAYVEARYGGGEPSQERLHWLNRQWLRLRAALGRGEGYS